MSLLSKVKWGVNYEIPMPKIVKFLIVVGQQLQLQLRFMLFRREKVKTKLYHLLYTFTNFPIVPYRSNRNKLKVNSSPSTMKYFLRMPGNISRYMLKCTGSLSFFDEQLDKQQSCTILLTIILVVQISAVLIVKATVKKQLKISEHS